MSNPKGFAMFHSQRLDGRSGAGNCDLSDTFYAEMLVRQKWRLCASWSTMLHVSVAQASTC